MKYTFHYAKPGDKGGFIMSLDPSALQELTLTEDIEAGSLREACREWDRLYDDTRLVVRISYPMTELEADGIQLGDGYPV
jgi:hypothetical protein